MNELTNPKSTDTSNLTPIEIALGIDENGMTTARRLYEFLEMDKSNFSRWVKVNITNNAFAIEDEDFWRFVVEDETPTGGKVEREDYKLTARFAKKLSMTQKNQRGEDARDYFTKVEDGAKEMVLQMQEMSPQLQFMINMELEQKRQKEEQQRQAEKIIEIEEKQDAIAQTFARTNSEDFRTWANRCLSKIAESKGYMYIGSPQERHKAAREESYERLYQKRPCRLKQRVESEKGRAAMAGASQTRINAINKLTVIENDKDLRPIYEIVIKEMMVAYCVQE